MEQVVLVDSNDREIGVEEKLKAHQKALRHRAFSIFVFRTLSDQCPSKRTCCHSKHVCCHSREGGNPILQLLLQQRQFGKYHSEGKWTNTCCGHPRPNESTEQGARRRLQEEMGLDLSLKEIGVFQYQAKCAEGIFENEVDHVFIGVYNDEPIDVNDEEIAAYRWEGVSELMQDLEQQSSVYTHWFKEAFLLALQYLKQENA